MLKKYLLLNKGVIYLGKWGTLDSFPSLLAKDSDSRKKIYENKEGSSPVVPNLEEFKKMDWEKGRDLFVKAIQAYGMDKLAGHWGVSKAALYYYTDLFGIANPGHIEKSDQPVFREPKLRKKTKSKKKTKKKDNGTKNNGNSNKNSKLSIELTELASGDEVQDRVANALLGLQKDRNYEVNIIVEEK